MWTRVTHEISYICGVNCLTNIDSGVAGLLLRDDNLFQFMSRSSRAVLYLAGFCRAWPPSDSRMDQFVLLRCFSTRELDVAIPAPRANRQQDTPAYYEVTGLVPLSTTAWAFY